MTEYSNSQIAMLIDEYIHSERDRKILKRRFIDGICYEPLADEFDMSVRQIKNIVYRQEKRLFSKIEEGEKRLWSTEAERQFHITERQKETEAWVFPTNFIHKKKENRQTNRKWGILLTTPVCSDRHPLWVAVFFYLCYTMCVNLQVGWPMFPLRRGFFCFLFKIPYWYGIWFWYQRPKMWAVDIKDPKNLPLNKSRYYSIPLGYSSNLHFYYIYTM